MLVQRMQRAAMMDPRLYDEVEHDDRANAEAAQVVIVASIATGLGTLLSAILRGEGSIGLLGFLTGLAAALLGWVVWSWATYFIGTRIFGGTATMGEMLRAMGFAQAPAVLRVFDFVPIVGWLIHVVVFIWLIATGITAVRQSLDFDTGRAIMTMIVGWVLMAFITAIYYGILHAMELS